VRSIQQLIKASVESEELLPRSRATIEQQLDDFFIFEVDRNPIACVALHVYPEEGTGELACLCVRASHENQGIGRTMIQFVEQQAREKGLRTLLVLSTQAFNYFRSKAGFAEGSPDDLPRARRERYDRSARNSKVLLKRLRAEAVGVGRSAEATRS
jgi:amino-acid N-acetyltransferase